MKDLTKSEEQALNAIGDNIRFIYNLVNYESKTAYIFPHPGTFEQAVESAKEMEEQLSKIDGAKITSENQAYIDDVREIIDINKRYHESGNQ